MRKKRKNPPSKTLHLCYNVQSFVFIRFPTFPRMPFTEPWTLKGVHCDENVKHFNPQKVN